MLKVAVIGLGRFGMAVAQRLALSGAQVIAIDRHAQLVNEIKDDVDLAVRLDSTDRQALLAQEIDKVEVCIVAIGENFEASLLTTVLVRQLGVPQVICRAQTAFHAEIFRQIGAHKVIQPEQEAGVQLARQLAHQGLMDFVPLSDGLTLIELKAPEAFHHKTIKALDLRAKYDVNLVVLRRSMQHPHDSDHATPTTQTIVPKANEVLLPEDVLVLIGSNESLARLPKE